MQSQKKGCFVQRTPTPRSIIHTCAAAKRAKYHIQLNSQQLFTVKLHCKICLRLFFCNNFDKNTSFLPYIHNLDDRKMLWIKKVLYLEYNARVNSI